MTKADTDLYPGVAHLVLGRPEAHTPVILRTSAHCADTLEQMACDIPCPLDLSAIHGQGTARGYVIDIPLGEDEEIYGFGLQMHSFRQRGKKKTIRVNSDPVADLGDSHAPVPFYVSTAGYAVLIDTARYAAFYVGSAVSAEQSRLVWKQRQSAGEQNRLAKSLFPSVTANPLASVTVDIPGAMYCSPAAAAARHSGDWVTGTGCALTSRRTARRRSGQWCWIIPRIRRHAPSTTST